MLSQDKHLKDNVKVIIQAELTERGILEHKPSAALASVSTMSQKSNLTFEEQKQLLLIEAEMKAKTLKTQKHIEMSKMQLQQQQLELERYCLDLIRDGKLIVVGSGLESESISCKFDVVGNLKLVPKFDEKDVERFLLLFERVADARNWPNEERTLMLQCVFIGRAQEAYFSLTADDAADYQKVKIAVLRAYELVPEAYRQKFRTWKKAKNKLMLSLCVTFQFILIAGVLLLT